MLSGRKALLLGVVLLAPVIQGCVLGGYLASAGALTVGYAALSEPATTGMTDISSVGGVRYVEDAVKIWLERDQLPLPVLEEGEHTFTIRSTGFVRVKGARGARVVQLKEKYKGQDRLIAEYVVSWDSTPEQYTLVRAVNRLYAGKLDVSSTPVLKTYNQG
jgi:hypothetical protein